MPIDWVFSWQRWRPWSRLEFPCVLDIRVLCMESVRNLARYSSLWIRWRSDAGLRLLICRVYRIPEIFIDRFGEELVAHGCRCEDHGLTLMSHVQYLCVRIASPPSIYRVGEHGDYEYPT